MNTLLDLFMCQSKADFEEKAAKTTVTQEDIVNVILGGGPEFAHIPVFRQYDAPNLADATAKLKAMNHDELKVGQPVPKPLLTMMNTLRQQRRQAGHFFWMPEYQGAWWILHFDTNDIRERDNHWEQGAHVHMLSWLTHPRSDPNGFLAQMRGEDRPKLPHPVHVRFKQIDREPARFIRPRVRPT